MTGVQTCALPISDIESMSILKDAASAALYGSRAANGVVMITTKKGMVDKSKVTLDARWGVANDYAKAKELAAWKERVVELWDSIEIVSCEKTEELASGNIESGKEYIITYVIDEKGLDDAVGIELVTTFTNAEGKEHIYSVEPMEVIKKEGNLYTFQVKHSLSNSGSFKVAYRMFPKNVDLPHRQDFCYVRWFNKSLN